MLIVLLFALSQAVSFTSLYDRQLKSSYGFEILKHFHDQEFGNEEVKHFKGESMLFLTPWREQGIPLAKKYIRKFDYFVPCYYDFVKRNQSIHLQISKHYSEEYLTEIKSLHPSIKIVPRVYVSGMQGDVFYLASTKDQENIKLLESIATIVNNSFYDGIVLSSPFLTPNHQFPFSVKGFLKEVRKICGDKLLIIAMDGTQGSMQVHHILQRCIVLYTGINPKPQQRINKKKAREIINFADKIVIANYDCPRSNEGINIPISPMEWIKQNYDFYCEVYSKSKLTPKLIMAIPLYGYYVAMFGKYEPIMGKELLQKLNKEKQAWMTWNQEFQECMIYLNKMEYLYFPCLHFFQSRLRYFESINVGVAAFEIGSALEIFMQMF